MKTLKFTIALVAVLLLTVSGVQPETTSTITDNQEIKEPTKVDLLAHTKIKVKTPTNG